MDENDKQFLEEFSSLVEKSMKNDTLDELESLIHALIETVIDTKVWDDPKIISDLVSKYVNNITDDVIEVTNKIEPAAAGFLAQSIGQFEKAERLFKNGYERAKMQLFHSDEIEDDYFNMRRLGFYAKYVCHTKDSDKYINKAKELQNKLELIKPNALDEFYKI